MDRPMPGRYFPSPAAGRFDLNPHPQQPLLFRLPVAANDQVPGEKANKAKIIERAAHTINDTLAQEKRYPELDSYIGRKYFLTLQAGFHANGFAEGISSDYAIPTSAAWYPFQKTKTYEIPDRIFEQYNEAHVVTIMGLFAELNHAWISIDNALYLWDYTHPNPELIGFEEQPHSITAVKLVKPRAGVFLRAITHLLVVSTTADILLIGVSCEIGPGEIRTISLYHTRMALPIRGMDIGVMEASKASGRIFFCGKGDDDVYELTYQQEEKWFQNRCGKINHSAKGLSALTPSFTLWGGNGAQERVVQMAIDDSRNLLYTLSSRSTIRTFHLKAPNSLDLVITRNLPNIFSNVGHMTPRSELFSATTSIVSISAISAKEASKLHLMATTSTGCRLFLSATSSYGWANDTSTSAPTSMQVQHIKFPPPLEIARPPQQNALQNPFQNPLLNPLQGGQRNAQQNAMQNTYQNSAGASENYQINVPVNTQSQSLIPLRIALRYQPGYFIVCKPLDGVDSIFLSAPDSGLIARPRDQVQMSKYHESGMWLNTGSRVEDIGLVSPPFQAADIPPGFGNEPATQFDIPTAEFAVLTSIGIQTFRRKRLVDIFAATLRHSGDEIEREVKLFTNLYGLGETNATALAVACGQGLDVTADSRIAKITDPDILEKARKIFIEYGGTAVLNQNLILNPSLQAVDNVQPSPRHQGIALYISRLLRSIWGAKIITIEVTPKGGFKVKTTISLKKLSEIQHDMTTLQEFLEKNKKFIDGLAGPEALSLASNKQEEVLLQAEHRALHSLVSVLSHIIEGISFVLVLFDEQVDEIILLLSEPFKEQVNTLTFEVLFTTEIGRKFAREMVKAIVNRNIAYGSNVDTVADALRRRCGSFCSADDVVIFKAQEQQKKASEAVKNSEHSRMLLNESLKLFQSVAGSLSFENLQIATEQYTLLDFFAGAIQLCLAVAKAADKGNLAFSWISDGRPENDTRKFSFEARRKIYDLIHQILTAVDLAGSKEPEKIDGRYSITATKRIEAYEVVNSSEDIVFQENLYDWYLTQGWTERILEVRSTYIIAYLEQVGKKSVDHADLLWKYYARLEANYEAACVQLKLAKSDFNISIEKRLEYLSLARTNASTRINNLQRQKSQILIHEINELQDVAHIQIDLLERLRVDDRVQPARRSAVEAELNGNIINLTTLYNSYADPAAYHDVCLVIYEASDYRDFTDIRLTWQNMLQRTHEIALERNNMRPFEAVSDQIRSLARRLRLSENTFNPDIVVTSLETYAFQSQNNVGPENWVISLLHDIHFTYEQILPVLENMLYRNEAPFHGPNRRIIAKEILYVIEQWYLEAPHKPFGDENHIEPIITMLQLLQQQNLLTDREVERAKIVIANLNRPRR